MLSEYSSNHAHITGDFGEHLVLYCLSKKGYECVHVRHVGVDLIASKDGKRMGISVKSRSRKAGIKDSSMTMTKPEKHIRNIKETCSHFACEGYMAFVLDQMDTIKVVITPLQVIEEIYTISAKSSQDWSILKFENNPRTMVYEIKWQDQ